MNAMTIKAKLNLIKQDWAYIFSIKTGKVVDTSNHCYQISKWIAWVFHFYYYSGLPFVLIFFLIYLSSIFTDIFYIRVIYSLFIFLLLEFVAFILMPLNKIKCWQKYKIGRK